jgi:CheY-like chemotaxis protein
MAPPILVAGMTARGLTLEAPMLLREGHVVAQWGSARELLLEIPRAQARLVVLGPDLPDLTTAETVRRIRASAVTRTVSVLVLLPAHASPETEEEVRDGGANAVLRRPVDPHVLEAWAAKLLAVSQRVDARVAVQAQVVGSSRSPAAPHFCGITRNVSVNGMLLASPVRLDSGLDLDLEFVVPGIPARLRGLGRVVREAAEVAWPYVGYGVEFLFMPPESREALILVVSGVAPSAGPETDGDSSHGIHSTLRRDDWVYEIRRPIRRAAAWQAEIRRAPKAEWKPGSAGPFFVVEATSPESAVREARAFVARQGA